MVGREGYRTRISPARALNSELEARPDCSCSRQLSRRDSASEARLWSHFEVSS